MPGLGDGRGGGGEVNLNLETIPGTNELELNGWLER